MGDPETREAGSVRRVTFCFPYHGSGGVPMQFLRLSSVLADRGWDVELVDYPDGTMARGLRDSRVRLVSYTLEGTPIAKDTILVLQTMTPWSIFPGLRVSTETRLLFWTCHPFNLVPSVPLLGRMVQRGPAIGRPLLRVVLPSHWSRLKRFLRLMADRQAIVFMDAGTARNSQEYLREKVDPIVFVPVPAPASATGFAPRAASAGPRQQIRGAWVGRLADFKYPILLHTMRRLDQVVSELGVGLTLTVVGSGEYLPHLQSCAATLRNIKVVFTGERAPGEVAEMLRTEVDIMFAMGTAALEAAAAGVPTILLDFTYNTVPDGYRYSWLHDRSGYSLGELISSEHLNAGDDELKTRLTELVADSNRLAERAHSYVQRGHTLPAVVDRLEPALSRTTLRWADLATRGFLQRGRLYRWYKAFQRK